MTLKHEWVTRLHLRMLISTRIAHESNGKNAMMLSLSPQGLIGSLQPLVFGTSEIDFPSNKQRTNITHFFWIHSDSTASNGIPI